jgi:hypothetical protein
MSSHDDRSGKVPEWMIERLAAGDLAPARARDVEQRLAREPDGQARVAALADSNAEILSAHPPAAMAEAIRQRAVEAARREAAARPRRSSAWLLGAPLLAAAAMAVVLVRPSPQPTEDGEGDGERIKGAAPSLHVYRKLGKKVERLADGAPTRAGDELQLAYVAGGRRFGAVVSLDGAGRITFHLPEGGGRSAALRTGGEVTLPQSYELDAAPRFERFLIVVGNAPFDTRALPDVLRGAAPPPAGTESFTFTVRKE